MDEQQEYKVIAPFTETLATSNLEVLSDIVFDTVEDLIDSIIDNPALSSIPIIKSIMGVVKIGKNIYDRNLLKQTAIFLNEFNNGGVDPDKMNAYRDRLKTDSHAKKETERVLLLLNANIEDKKSRILAGFYKAYINGEIRWEEFCELSETLSLVFVNDLVLLNRIYKKQVSSTVFSQGSESFRFNKLEAIGLVLSVISGIRLGSGNSATTKHLSCTPLGEKFCNITNRIENLL